MLPPGTIEAFGLYLVRTSAMVLAAPLLGTGATFSGYKVGLVALISFLLFSISGSPLTESVLPIEYGIFVMREILIGLFLAFTLQVVVLAARIGGDLIGHEMAFNMSNVVDPVSGVSTPLIASMYEMFFFLGVLALNGHHWLVRALAESYERAPVGSIHFEAGLPAVALGMFVQLFSAGITFAAPILVLLMVVSLLIGLLSRTVPQLNVMEFGFNIRIAMALVAMLAFVPFLSPAITWLMERFMLWLETGLDALGA